MLAKRCDAELLNPTTHTSLMIYFIEYVLFAQRIEVVAVRGEIKGKEGPIALEIVLYVHVQQTALPQLTE